MIETPTLWDGVVSETANWGNTVTTMRIGVQWLRYTLESMGRGTSHIKTISAHMRSLGWEPRRQRIDGMTARPWVWTVSEAIFGRWDRNSEHADTVQQSISTDNDDIPF